MSVSAEKRRAAANFNIIMSIFPLAFAKMSGAGNDFVIIDHRRPLLDPADQPDFARKICRRKFSVGADGLILLEDSDVADFKWQFYNADGSVAEMCGNGARCAARFAYRHGIAGKTMRFETVAGAIEAEILDEDETVSVLMTDPVDHRPDRIIDVDGRHLTVASINTGVPHAVIFIDVETIPVKEWGREIRFHHVFQPAGTNVNFARLLPDGRLHVRTYERGVEDETMACGTGAVAAALIAGLRRMVRPPVQVVTSGGERLTVAFDLSEGRGIGNIHLQGPARLIYEGLLTAESLL